MSIPRNLRALSSGYHAWRLARESIRQRGAIQHVDELAAFAKLVRSISPKRVMEIGTAQGGVFWLLCQISAPDATLISLDLPPSDRMSGGEKVDIDLQSMKQPDQRVFAVHGSSHDTDVHGRAAEILNGDLIDLLFIDGDHTYEGVASDYEMYRPLVRPGGIIAFHDIIRTPWPDCNVDRFWGELSSDKRLQPRSLLTVGKASFGGIGIVTS